MSKVNSNVIMVVFLLIPLAFFNYTIFQKEQIKIHGETIFLELAPVDPRSLMQGDYMRLNYALNNKAPKAELEKGQKKGYMVVQADENNVGQFVRYYQNEDLTDKEKLFYFTVKNAFLGRVEIFPNSFLFQEGYREYYNQAKYGVFKFVGGKDYLLVDLADENKQLISPKLAKQGL